MEDREQTAPLPEESHTIAPRRTKSWRRRVAIGLVVLAGVVFLFRGLLVRTIQYSTDRIFSRKEFTSAM
jgi:hypothetical protein